MSAEARANLNGREPRVLLAIPVYNEAATIAEVIAAVRRVGWEPTIFDDGSTDASASLARAASASVVSHGRNRGYGAITRTILNHAAAEQFEWAITMDCDEQHEPESIPDFMRAIQHGDADIVSGSRYLASGDRADGDDLPPPDRRRINALLTRELNATLGLGITDAFCGFKAYRVLPCAALPLTTDGYEFPLEFWVRAARANLRIREIPVRRIYADLTRTFGGVLDDAELRLAHYRSTLHKALGDRPCRRATCCSKA